MVLQALSSLSLYIHSFIFAAVLFQICKKINMMMTIMSLQYILTIECQTRNLWE